MNFKSKSKPALSQRLLREAKELAFLTVYFYVAFATITFFKATVLLHYGVHYLVWGGAILKAVLIAKFMLVGRAMKIGKGHRNNPLIKRILSRVFGFLLLLIVLTSTEQITMGLIHHHPLAATLHEVAGSQLREKLAELLILLLALAPLVAFSVFTEAIGEDTVKGMLFIGGPIQVTVLEQKT